MSAYYITPNGDGTVGLLRIDGAVAVKPAWIEITAEQYATYSAVQGRLRVVGGAPSVQPAPPVRVIPRGDFIDRFTQAEQIALETIAEGQTQAGRIVRVFTRRLDAETHVNLDATALAAALGQLKTILVTAGVWANETDADTRIAALTADG